MACSVEHGEPPTVKAAACLFHELCYNNKDALSAGIICAGWDKREGGSVYNIPLGGSLHRQSYAIGGESSMREFHMCLTVFRFWLHLYLRLLRQ